MAEQNTNRITLLSVWSMTETQLICAAMLGLLACGSARGGNAAQRMIFVPDQDIYSEQVDQIVAALSHSGTIPSQETARALSVEQLFGRHLRAAQKARSGTSTAARPAIGVLAGSDGGRLYTLLASRMDELARMQLAEPVKTRFAEYTSRGDNFEAAGTNILRDVGSFDLHAAQLEHDVWETAANLNTLVQQRSGGRSADMTGDIARNLFRQAHLHPDDYERLHGILETLVDKARIEAATITAAAAVSAEALDAPLPRSPEVFEHLP